MTTRTHTEEWHPLIKWGALITTLGIISYVAWASSTEPHSDLGASFALSVVAGIALILIGGVKHHGSLRTGLWATAIGIMTVVVALLAFAPLAGKREPTLDIFIERGDLFTLLSELLSTCGVLSALTGIILTVVGFVRRGRAAVEGKTPTGN